MEDKLANSSNILQHEISNTIQEEDIVSQHVESELIIDNHEPCLQPNGETSDLNNEESHDPITTAKQTNRQSITSTSCNVCGFIAVKKEKRVLLCHNCNGLVHFHCTRLPPYMIYTFSTSSKRYVCEACADTPIPFLEEMIQVGLHSYEKPEKNDIRSEHNGDNRDYKENEMAVIFEKYDFEAIAKNLLELGNTLRKTNENMVENIGTLKADKKKERNTEAMTNNQKKEKEELDKLETSMKILEAENNHLKTLNDAYHQERVILRKTYQEQIQKLENKIEELTNKCTDIYGKWEAGHLANEIISKQLDDLVAANDRLEKNLTLSLSNVTPTNVPQSEESPNKRSENNKERMVIFHDSLCRKINETILSRENVISKKVWAPNLHQMSEKLDEIESTETIVIQALTRDVASKSVEEMNNGIDEVVNKALAKSKNIVLSTIVAREDVRDINHKIDLINANMKYRYKENERVFICDNVNLNNVKFRWEDGIHLTEHGTSVLATNLKYKVAEALDIKVLKKDKRKYTNHRFDHRK